VHVRGVNTRVGEWLGDYVRTHLGFKLGKYATHIERASVRFFDASGPKGAPQRACRIKVVMARSSSVVVEGSALGPREAFDHAAEVIETAVGRLLQRRRDRSR
jgi:ribosome-associated translation inhibitor RaiA